MAIACGAALVGCDPVDEPDGGGDGTEQPGDQDEGPTSGQCGEETTSTIEDLEAALDGFVQTPAEYLAGLEAEQAGTLEWRPDDGPVINAHAETSTELTIAFQAGTVRLVEVEMAGEFPGGQEGGQPCSNTLEFDGTLSFVTADGVFDESMPATLKVSSHPFDDGGPVGLALYEALDLGASGGSLDAADFTFTDDSTLNDVYLTGTVAASESSGDVAIEMQSPGPDDGWVGFGAVGTWSTASAGG